MCLILSAVSVMGPGELGHTGFVSFESFGLDSIDWYESDSDFIVLTYQILDSKKVLGQRLCQIPIHEICVIHTYFNCSM